MKKFYSVLITAIVACGVFFALPFTVSASTLTSGDYRYEILDDGTASITDYTGSATNLEIPSEINGYKVTTIGRDAFRGCSNLTSIVIPDSVISIGYYAFSACSSLTSINIPDNITSIGWNVFWGCSSLTSIDIPDSVTEIGDYAFLYCSSLTSITIPDSVNRIRRGAFSNCSSLTSITLPDCSIDYEAFANCSSLTSITIPDSVTSIPDKLFFNCSSLTSITIPNSVTSIGDYAFADCSNLTSITVPDSVTLIWGSSFEGCSNLTSIEVDDNNSRYYDISGVLFDKKVSGLILYPTKKMDTEYIIPNNVTSIGDFAFSYCSNLTSITIPDSVTSIDDFAFIFCSNLTSIIFSEGVTSIGDYAFSYCSSLNSITIPDSVTSIGFGAFLNCSSLTSIDISNSVTTIDDSVFSGCLSLVSINIPDNVTLINHNRNFEEQILILVNAERAKYGLNPLKGAITLDKAAKLRAVELGLSFSHTRPDGTEYFTVINNYGYVRENIAASQKTPVEVMETWMNSSGYRANILDENFTHLGIGHIYKNRHYWTQIFISANQMSDEYSSENVTTDYYFEYRILEDGTAEITGYTGMETKLEIPSEIDGYTVTSVGEYAFENCDFVTSITIPYKITSIGDNAFDGCSNLTIYGYSGSTAETYAKNNGILFADMGELPTPTVKIGDVNIDNAVNIVDLVMLCKHIVGIIGSELTGTALTNSDCDGDGNTISDADDAIKLAQFLVKKIPSLPNAA